MIFMIEKKTRRSRLSKQIKKKGPSMSYLEDEELITVIRNIVTLKSTFQKHFPKMKLS
jgi:hypothetical protein